MCSVVHYQGEWGVGRLGACQMQAPLTPPLWVFLICLTDTSGGISCFYSVSTASTAPASINKTLSPAEQPPQPLQPPTPSTSTTNTLPHPSDHLRTHIRTFSPSKQQLSKINTQPHILSVLFQHSDEKIRCVYEVRVYIWLWKQGIFFFIYMRKGMVPSFQRAYCGVV